MPSNTTSQLSGPEFLQAVAEAELALGNTINAGEYERRAQQWRDDIAQRDHCHGCHPGLVAEHAAALVRIAELEARLHNVQQIATAA